MSAGRSWHRPQRERRTPGQGKTSWHKPAAVWRSAVCSRQEQRRPPAQRLQLAQQFGPQLLAAALQQPARTLLATWLNPERTILTGRRTDLLKAREGQAGRELNAIEQRLTTVDKHLLELTAFIETLAQCAERGPLGKEVRW